MAHLRTVHYTLSTLAPALPVLALVVDYVVWSHLDYLVDRVRHQDRVQVSNNRVLPPALLLWLVFRDLCAIHLFRCLASAGQVAVLTSLRPKLAVRSLRSR